jgi:hypothetical protein
MEGPCSLCLLLLGAELGCLWKLKLLSLFIQFSMFFSIVYAYHLELSTGVFINGGRTMDWIKDLEQTAKPFEVKYV